MRKLFELAIRELEPREAKANARGKHDPFAVVVNFRVQLGSGSESQITVIAKNTIIQNVNRFLKPLGFVRAGVTWRRIGDELVTVFNLQKSAYDSTYYMNIGFFV